MSFGIGIILFVFIAMQGIGRHFIRGDLEFAAQHQSRVAPGPAREMQGNLPMTDHRPAALAADLTEEQLRPVAAQPSSARRRRYRRLPTLPRRGARLALLSRR